MFYHANECFIEQVHGGHNSGQQILFHEQDLGGTNI